MRANVNLTPRKAQAKKNEGSTHAKAFVRRRNQKSFLHQANTGASPERKNFDVFTTFAPPVASAFATPQLLNGIANGSGGTERIGRKILIKSVQWRAIFQPAAPASQHRVVIFYDKQANGAAPAITDIMETNAFTSPLRLGNSDRFVIISDEVTDSSQSSSLTISDKVYTKCTLETSYIGTGGTIASIGTGAIWCMIANNGGTIIGVATSVDIHLRVRYLDQ